MLGDRWGVPGVVYAFRDVGAILLAACTFMAADLAFGREDPDFPLPDGLRPAVGFWKRVYTEISTDAGFLHDSRHLGVVFEAVRFQSEEGRRTRERRIEKRRQMWRQALLRLGDGIEPRDAEERGVLRALEEALGHPPTARDLTLASRRIRFQLGQRDKFRTGLIRSGASEDAMRAVFHDHGLPEDLAYLPHVESSFNIHAYSKYGAAGLWQFMRSTGRRYLQIDYVVDERLDPMVATKAAARLLQENYKALGTWPLAITAYNHGRSGMSRAVRMTGTRDIDVIVDRYASRTFGFASRNFYAQFLAARAVLRSYESWFGRLKRDDPEPVDEIVLPFYMDVGVLHDHLDVPPEVVQHYNPALRPPVFRSGKRIPQGYTLRLPAGTVQPGPDQWLARVKPEHRYAKQHQSRFYQVRRGDNLSAIAREHGTSVGSLVAMNNLPSRHRIYAGQVLEIPGASEAPARTIPKTARAEVEPVQVKPTRADGTPPAPPIEPAPPDEPRPAAAPPTSEEPTAPIDQTASIEPAPSVEPAALVEATPSVEPAGARDAMHDEAPTSAATPPLPADSPWRRIDGDFIIVDTDETLGHYAEWLQIRAQRLRELNGLRAGRHLRIGQRLRLDFSRVPPDLFSLRRMEYHKGIEEDFFGSYRVAGTVVHDLRRGESPWYLAQRLYGVPLWLIHRYNPELDLENLRPGARLRIPVVEKIEGA